MSDDTRHQHTELHERFRNSLSQRRQLIVDQWTELRTVRWSNAGVDILRVWVHQMAGSGTMFGYSALGEYARELEHRLNGVMGGASHSNEVIAGIAASIERLKIQIDRVLAMDPAELPGQHPVHAQQTVFILSVPNGETSHERVLAQLRERGFNIQAAQDVDDLLKRLEPQSAAVILLSEETVSAPTPKQHDELVAVASDKLSATAINKNRPARVRIGPPMIAGELPVERLSLHLQHTVDERGNEVGLFDVLVRLRDEHGEVHAAREFLPDIEARGLDAQLDLWVVRAAIAHLCALPTTARPLELAVRLSASSIEAALLFPVLNALQAQIPQGSGHRLVFQIDEYWLATHERVGVELVLALRDVGCGAMLSNFGGSDHPRSSAWASWFDYAKLAPQRLDALATRGDGKLRLENMIRDGLQRGARIVACQLESPPALKLLTQWGVRLFQGRLVGL